MISNCYLYKIKKNTLQSLEGIFVVGVDIIKMYRILMSNKIFKKYNIQKSLAFYLAF